MGFVPLAYRAGSEAKSRVHIFWQKRIRAGDVTTPYWFPSQTTGGSIREDRLVLPIPPGTHWADAKPMILPKEQAPERRLPEPCRNQRNGKPVVKKREPLVLGQALWFATPPAAEPVKEAKPKREKRKNDPALVAAARELRDRWLEQVNDDPSLLLSRAKYDVARALPETVPIVSIAALPAAA
jgi:hypothetical protein